MADPDALPSTVTLLTSIQEKEEGSWSFDEALMVKGLDELAGDLKGARSAEAISQFLNILGMLGQHLGREDMAHRLIFELDGRLDHAHVERFRSIIEDKTASRVDEAERNYRKLVGGPQANPGDGVPEPKEKIDFQLPKGSIKG